MKGLIRGMLLALVGVLAMSVSASAQCKLEDLIEKYKSDARCNSVNMSKEMLAIIANQRKMRLDDEIKKISSIKILSVKMPRTKGFINGFTHFGSNGVTATFEDGAMAISGIGEKMSKSDQEKLVKEKLAEKEAEQKKKIQEYKALADDIAKQAGSCIEAAKYSELMSINEDGKVVKYYARQEAEKIKEFIVLTSSAKEFSLIVIKGDDIQISSVSRLGSIVPNADFDIDLY